MITAFCKTVLRFLTFGRYKGGDKDDGISGQQATIMVLMTIAAIFCCCGTLAYGIYQFTRHKKTKKSKAQLPIPVYNTLRRGNRMDDDEDAIPLSDLMSETQIEQRISELEGQQANKVESVAPRVVVGQDGLDSAFAENSTTAKSCFNWSFRTGV